MTEMTAAKAADFLDGLADGCEIDMQGESDYHSEWIKKLRYSSSILRRVASGELAPVIHAHWIGERGYLVHECSNCHKEFTEAEESDLEVLDFDYCPSCGALMDERDDKDAE